MREERFGSVVQRHSCDRYRTAQNSDVGSCKGRVENSPVVIGGVKPGVAGSRWVTAVFRRARSR